MAHRDRGVFVLAVVDCLGHPRRDQNRRNAHAQPVEPKLQKRTNTNEPTQMRSERHACQAGSTKKQQRGSAYGARVRRAARAGARHAVGRRDLQKRRKQRQNQEGSQLHSRREGAYRIPEAAVLIVRDNKQLQTSHAHSVRASRQLRASNQPQVPTVFIQREELRSVSYIVFISDSPGRMSQLQRPRQQQQQAR